MRTEPSPDLRGDDVLAADGGIVRLRAVSPDDARGLADLYARGSAENLRLRFHGAPGVATLAGEVARLVRPPAADHDVVLAEQDGTLVGVASYERPTATDRRAEFAVFVDEAQHGRGHRHTAAGAPRRRMPAGAGVTELVGDVLAGNTRDAAAWRPTCRPARHGIDEGVVGVRDAHVARRRRPGGVDARDRTAERASLRPLLAPRAVAVVGAGRQPGGIGHATLRRLWTTASAAPVRGQPARGRRSPGVPAYPRVAAIPGQVDLVVIAVPAAGRARRAGRAARRRGAGRGGPHRRASARPGPTGSSARPSWSGIARRTACGWSAPTASGCSTPIRRSGWPPPSPPALPPAGGLALASQSGAVGHRDARPRRPHRHRASPASSRSGNKADVSGNDLLAYWYDDPATTAVALYLESFGNPRRFARIARALARRKPVLAVKSGRSAAGQRAGASHTAAAAAPDVAGRHPVRPGRRDPGRHLGELLDAARMLTDQPLPAGRPARRSSATPAGSTCWPPTPPRPAGLRCRSCPPRARAASRWPRPPRRRQSAGPGRRGDPAAFAAALGLVGQRRGRRRGRRLRRHPGQRRAGVARRAGRGRDRHLDCRWRRWSSGADARPRLGERRAPGLRPARAGRPRRWATPPGTPRGGASPLGIRPQLSDVDRHGARAVVADRARSTAAAGSRTTDRATSARPLRHPGRRAASDRRRCRQAVAAADATRLPGAC